MADALVTGWGHGEPIDDSVLRGFVFNQADVIRAFACGPGSRYERTDDVAMADGNVPVAYVNMTVLLRPVTSPDDPVLDTVAAFYVPDIDRAAMLLSAWPMPDVAHRGWQLVGHPMFVVRSPGPVTANLRSGVEVRDVTATDALRTLERVAIDGYQIPEAASAPPGATYPDGLLASDLTLRLGLVDGEPVSAAAGSVAHGVTNLCFAATLPAGRRRGVWSALVWSRVAEAPDLPAVAFTSDDSRPGFIKHGFLPLMRFTLLVRPPPG